MGNYFRKLLTIYFLYLVYRWSAMNPRAIIPRVMNIEVNGFSIMYSNVLHARRTSALITVYKIAKAGINTTKPRIAILKDRRFIHVCFLIIV